MNGSTYLSWRLTYQKEVGVREERVARAESWALKVQHIRPEVPSIAETPKAQGAGRRMDFPVGGSRVNGLGRLARSVILMVGV
jgi:hypothetical protein